jgi:AraC-like DNA-binding protein
VAATAELTFTTRGVPVPARRGALRVLAERGLVPVEPLDEHAPAVELVKWRLPGASVLWGRFAGVRQVAAVGSGADDDLFFGINVAGAGLARQRGREVAVASGAAVALDLCDGAFTVLRPAASKVIGVRVPRRSVATQRTALQLVPSDTAAVQLLTRYLRSARGTPVPSSEQLADAFVTHIVDLIALSLRGADARPAPDDSIRAVRLFTIKSDIEQCITDSSLTASAVAARHGISTRYLHKLFEYDATTYSQFVLDRRLELARRRLRDPRYAGRTITAIASDAGFGDLSYFNRTFRRRYDVTPSLARREG